MNPVIFDDLAELHTRFNDWSWLKGRSVLVTGAYGMLASYLIFMLIYLNEQDPGYEDSDLCTRKKHRKDEGAFFEVCRKRIFSHYDR